MALSDSKLKAAKPTAKPYRMTDGQGLSLVVQPSGRKSWQYIYRHQGKQATLSIGAYPDIGLADARELRAKAAKDLAQGRDPRDVKKGIVPEGAAFRDFAKGWYDAWSVGKRSANSERMWSMVEKNAFPVFGHKAMPDITSADVLKAIRTVEARGAIYTGRRLKRKVSEIFRYARGEGVAIADPTVDVGEALKPLPRVQHHQMVGTTGLGDLSLKIEQYDGDAITRLALQFTLITGVRTAESRFARWGEIEGALWRIPAERMKMHREHLVPLSRQALEVLEEARKLGRGDLVFPAHRSGGAMSNNTMLFALYRMGMHSKQTVHGFRRLFSTTLNEQGWNADWVEVQLAHGEGNAVRGAYNAALYLPGRTEMMQAWADHIDGERYKALLP